MKPYLKDKYELYVGRADKYVYFFEKSLKLLKDNGYLGYICSDKYTKTDYGKKLRNKLSSKTTILRYNQCENVFNANVNTAIIILRKKEPKNNKIYINSNYYLNQKELTSSQWAIDSEKALLLKNKLLEEGIPIKKIKSIFINQGIKSGHNKSFILTNETRKKLITEDFRNKNIIKPLLKGKDVKQYHITNNGLYLLYIPWNFQINEYSSIKNYLKQFETELKNRAEVKLKKYEWYCLHRYASGYKEDFQKDKIIFGEIVQEPHFYYDEDNYYTDATTFILTSTSYNLKYLTAILNSNVLFWFMKKISGGFGINGVRYKKIDIMELPLPQNTYNKTLEKKYVLYRNCIKIWIVLIIQILKKIYNKE